MMDLSINKKIFKENLNCKNYSNCIYMLDEEIKEMLILLIRGFNKNYVYKNLDDLKNNCLKYLDYDQKLLVLEFYDISMNPVNELQELKQLLKIYDELNKSHIDLNN